jgi:hypothetical protein
MSYQETESEPTFESAAAVEELAPDAGVYRSIGHWDRSAIVKHDGRLYPCRFVGSLVGHFVGRGREDSGERAWAAEAIGLPAGLTGNVTVIVPGGEPVAARLTGEGGLAGTGAPWLLGGETSPWSNGDRHRRSAIAADGVARVHNAAPAAGD